MENKIFARRFFKLFQTKYFLRYNLQDLYFKNSKKKDKINCMYVRDCIVFTIANSGGAYSSRLSYLVFYYFWNKSLVGRNAKNILFEAI